MTVNRAWMARNLGFDPVITPAPAATFTNKSLSVVATRRPEDLQREIIDFDSQAPEGLDRKSTRLNSSH